MFKKIDIFWSIYLAHRCFKFLSAAIDGARAMTGRHKGFIAHLKQAVPNVLAVHCIKFVRATIT
jgi:hypothetical protein